MFYDLNPGDKVGLVSPSRFVTKEDIVRGVAYLQSLGFEVITAPHAFDKFRFMAGTAEARAEDLMMLYQDKSVKAIFATSGGDGAQYLPPLLDWKIIAKNPGKVACFMGTRYEWTKSQDYTNVYYTDTTNVVNCYDMTNYDTPIPLKKVNSIEDVNNTEGSYYFTPSRIYINMNYYTLPTSDNVAVIRSYGTSFSRIVDTTATQNWTVYFKDLIFVGSQNFAFRIDYKSDNIKHLFIAENCKFLCGQYVNSGSETIAGVAGGVRIEHGNAILKNCIASLNQR